MSAINLEAALRARIVELEEALRDLIETTPNSDAPEWVAARAVVAAADALDGGQP